MENGAYHLQKQWVSKEQPKSNEPVNRVEEKEDIKNQLLIFKFIINNAGK